MPTPSLLAVRFAAALLTVFVVATAPIARAAESGSDTFSSEEILKKAEGFFGETTEGLAKAIEHVFNDLGRPNAYVAGEEAAGAFFVGLRYGRGKLTQKNGVQDMPIYWQGPSVGFDWGGNAAKTFVLIYRLKSAEEMYQRFPGVDGSAYFVAGVGVNYQQAGNIVLAPIRTGVGLRLGANIGYLHYTRTSSWVPF